MTIVEAVNKLLEHFHKKDSFNMEDDYASLMKISETPEEDKAAYVLALEEMEKTDIIKCFTSGKRKIFLLKKPLNSFDQNINVGGYTCNMIAKVINDFCEKVKDKRDYCDPRSINEKDIRNLLFLASMAYVDKEKQNLDTE